NVIQLSVPPLRKRLEDLPVLIEAILARISQNHGLAKPTLSRDALKALQEYAYPGNIRELENILERAFTLCDGNQIAESDLQLDAVKNLDQRREPSSGAGHYQA